MTQNEIKITKIKGKSNDRRRGIGGQVRVKKKQGRKNLRVTTGAMRAHTHTHTTTHPHAHAHIHIHAHFIIEEIVGGNGSLDHTRKHKHTHLLSLTLSLSLSLSLSLQLGQEETSEQHNFSFKPLK